MAEKHRVTLQICGQRVTSEKFAKGVLAFLSMLEEVSSDVTNKKGAITWVVTVQSGSSMLVAEAEPKKPAYADYVLPILQVIQGGLESLEHGTEVPHQFKGSLENAKDIASLHDEKDKGITGINLIVDNSPIEITHNIFSHVEDIINVSQAKALGTIEGQLEMVTKRGGYKCAVYDELTDKRIECIFNRKIKENIRDAWDSRVSMYGIITYDASGQPTSIRVQEFRRLGEGKLPTFEDVKGIYKD